MKILNLGCGTKASSHPNVINIDWSITLWLKHSKILRPLLPLLIRERRMEKLRSLPDNIMVHDLSKGIPFGSGSVDVVYHSHVLEHLDRDVAAIFLTEVKRVLKPGGIHRIVVPDLEKICADYLAHISYCDRHHEELHSHDFYVAALLEQSVRKEAYGTSQQSTFRRFVENLLLGDARRRGETHQWMYDRISLKEQLLNAGYVNVCIQDYNTSQIANWNSYGLDINEAGEQYKPGSLYMEARVS